MIDTPVLEIIGAIVFGIAGIIVLLGFFAEDIAQIIRAFKGEK